LFALSLSGAVAQEAEQALTLDAIVNSLQKGLPPSRAAALVKARGVNFQLTKGQEERLRGAGADDQLIAEVRRAGEEYARRAKAGEERKKLEEERKKVEEERRKIEEARKRAEEERKKMEAVARKVEEERRVRAEEERKKLEEARAKLEEERKKAEGEKRKTEELAEKRTADVREGRVAPTVREGDFWYFKGVETGFKRPPSTSIQGDYQVVVSGGVVRVFKVAGEKKGIVPGPEGNFLRRFLGSAKSENEWLRFPLVAGQRWTGSYIGFQGGVIKAESAVAGIEEVETPAGRFRAFKVERVETAERGGPWAFTYFYSPEVRSIVKLQIEFRGGPVRDVQLMKYGSGLK